MSKKKHTKSAICLLTFLSLLALPFVAVASADKTPAQAPAANQEKGASKGMVLETMDAAGYTYFQVETSKGKAWVAVPQAKVTVGEEISYYDGIVMPNFSSKTLGKTFDNIIFSAGLVGQVKDPTAGGAMMGGMGNPHQTKSAPSDNSFAAALQAEGAGAPQAAQASAGSSGSMGAMAPQAEIKTAKASGDNAYTVAEIFAKKDTLNGKSIRIHGKVVKYSPNIMGRNWIHIQDGTGDAMKNTHDLVVTTTDRLDGKEEITIEGTVIADKDFGAGYRYVVIIEEAKIQ